MRPREALAAAQASASTAIVPADEGPNSRTHNREWKQFRRLIDSADWPAELSDIAEDLHARARAP